MRIVDHLAYLMFAVALGLGGYHYGRVVGKDEVRAVRCSAKLPPRIVYSTVELQRMLSARKRMEKVVSSSR